MSVTGIKQIFNMIVQLFPCSFMIKPFPNTIVNHDEKNVHSLIIQQIKPRRGCVPAVIVDPIFSI